MNLHTLVGRSSGLSRLKKILLSWNRWILLFFLASAVLHLFTVVIFKGGLTVFGLGPRCTPNITELRHQNNVFVSKVMKKWTATNPGPMKGVYVDLHSAYVTIGVVCASSVQGLYVTLNSLIQFTTAAQKKEMNIVVFLATQVPRRHNNITESIARLYTEEFRTGFIQVVEIDRSMLKTIHGLPARVTWIETGILFAHIFHYVFQMNSSEFYIHLEEGMLPARYNFLKEVRTFLQARVSVKPKMAYSIVEFADRSIFGTLFKVHELDQLANLLTMFPRETLIEEQFQVFRYLKAQLFRAEYKNLFYYQGQEPLS